MEKNINSPRYYKDIYGIDNEINQLCQNIYLYFKGKKYSDIINVVGIVPIIAPQEYINQGKYHEKKLCSPAYGYADVQLFVDYDSYVNGSIEEKKIYIILNVLKSVKTIRSKGKIDYSAFEKDMIEFCEKCNINLAL